MDRTSHRRSLDQVSIQTGMRSYPIGHHSDTILRRKEHVRSLLKLPINVYEKCCGKFESLLTSFINEGSITDWAYLIYGTGDKACGHFEGMCCIPQKLVYDVSLFQIWFISKRAMFF